MKSNKRNKALNMMLVLLFMTTLTLTGCEEKKEENVIEKIRQVSVVTVSEEAYKESVRYTGFVTASQVIPMSFSSNGKVEKVMVKEGQKIKTGDALISLYATGAQAETLYSGMDGVVAEVYTAPDELVGKEQPVLVLRTDDQVIQVGVTDKDIERIEKFGDPVTYFEINDKKISAKLKDMNKLPDQISRTYTVTVTLEEEKDLLIGQMGTVSFELARISGIWLPISWIQNDGEDYVYIVSAENRVERRNLKLNELNLDKVRVDGLAEGDRIITVGNAYVKEGQSVTAREASHE